MAEIFLSYRRQDSTERDRTARRRARGALRRRARLSRPRDRRRRELRRGDPALGRVGDGRAGGRRQPLARRRATPRAGAASTTRPISSASRSSSRSPPRVPVVPVLSKARRCRRRPTCRRRSPSSRAARRSSSPTAAGAPTSTRWSRRCSRASRSSPIARRSTPLRGGGAGDSTRWGVDLVDLARHPRRLIARRQTGRAGDHVRAFAFLVRRDPRRQPHAAHGDRRRPRRPRLARRGRARRGGLAPDRPAGRPFRRRPPCRRARAGVAHRRSRRGYSAASAWSAPTSTAAPGSAPARARSCRALPCS